ncbi:MAG: tripartite tricarboxylate transporter TctB family protein [Alphaproteobacteria bacterium]|nr:tripartite tricarboxylate transporter TctB family protein [Alphaproteobacteria bacterium]
MSNQHVQHRWAEVVVALFFSLIGSAVIWDSLRVGMQWGDDGPQPGYFPFYIGVLLLLGAAKVLWGVISHWDHDTMTDSFATYEELGLVMKMFWPTIVYVGTIFVLGLYVASALFIAFFMIWQGKYSGFKATTVGIAVPLVLFALFEIWFLLPLPKGPLEALFGF